ncbi:UNVERIFIED_ORG: hypothetical protein E4P37_11870, partial [Bacillus sp. AZ43]
MTATEPRTETPAAARIRDLLADCGIEATPAELDALAAADGTASAALRFRGLPLRDLEPARGVHLPPAEPGGLPPDR